MRLRAFRSGTVMAPVNVNSDQDDPEDPFWVFGYGSLMWRPDFPFVAREPARLHGLHRSFCVYSIVHRGSRQRPGLVLGLDRGGSCLGIAFAVEPALVAEVRAYLRAREQITAVYREVFRPVALGGGPDRVRALCYVVDPGHPQFAGRLSLEAQAALIARAQGGAGRNADYLDETVRELDRLAIREGPLHRLRGLVATLTGAEANTDQAQRE